MRQKKSNLERYGNDEVIKEDGIKPNEKILERGGNGLLVSTPLILRTQLTFVASLSHNEIRRLANNLK